MCFYVLSWRVGIAYSFLLILMAHEPSLFPFIHLVVFNSCTVQRFFLHCFLCLLFQPSVYIYTLRINATVLHCR
jgi:hypothetical protein